MSGKLQAGDKGGASRKASDAEIAKLGLSTLGEALRAKAADPSAPEFKAANAMNSARDIGYTAALVDVIAARPDATGSAQEVLDAWTEAINALTPQPPA